MRQRLAGDRLIAFEVQAANARRRQAFAAARTEDHLAQARECVVVSARERRVAGPRRGGSLAQQRQGARTLQEELHLVARRQELDVNRLARDFEEPDDLARVVAVEEAEDEDARRLRLLLPHADVVAHAAQLVARLDARLRVGRAQPQLGRVELHDGELPQPRAGRAAELRQVEVAEHRVEVTLDVFDRLEVGLPEGEEEEEVVQQVFGRRAVAARQV